jgi:hypothetical protein
VSRLKGKIKYFVWYCHPATLPPSHCHSHYHPATATQSTATLPLPPSHSSHCQLPPNPLPSTATTTQPLPQPQPQPQPQPLPPSHSHPLVRRLKQRLRLRAVGADRRGAPPAVVAARVALVLRHVQSNVNNTATGGSGGLIVAAFDAREQGGSFDMRHGVVVAGVTVWRAFKGTAWKFGKFC